MLSEDMAANLSAYFAWSRSGDPSDVGYPHQDAVRALRGGGVGCAGLSDDEALWLDEALCLLKIDAPHTFSVLEKVHGQGRSYRWLEKRGYGNRKVIAVQVAEGHQFVNGYLVAHKKIMGAHAQNSASGG
jgi:hypothetical protein